MFQRHQLANLLSVSRLGFLPLIVLAGLLDRPAAFVGLFGVQLALDAVDGFVARRLHIESDLGRRLDTVIDLAIWLPSLVVFTVLAWDELSSAFRHYPVLFIIPLLTTILMYLTAYRTLHAVAAMHLYTGKATSVLVLALMVTVLLDRFYLLLGILTAGMGVAYHLEATAIYFIQGDRTDENVTSIWRLFHS